MTSDNPVAARVIRRELTPDGRGVRVEWRCGACGAIGTPQDSMFEFQPKQCDACRRDNAFEAQRDG